MGAPAKPPPPEATLLRVVREAAGLSPEAAAAKVEIRLGGTRWRQIERGWRSDTDAKVVALPATLAHMCLALGISSKRLADTGRQDAVTILQELERAKAEANEERPEPAPLADLEEWQQQIILNALDERKRTGREKALLLRTLAAKIEAQDTDGEDGGAEESAPHKIPGRSA